MSPPVYTAIATVIVASIITFGGWLVGRRPNEISGAKEITESALLLVEPQSARIQDLIAAVDGMSVQVDNLSTKIMKLERHVDILSAQIISMGAVPAQLEGH